MRLSLRFVVPLLLVLAATAYGMLPLADSLMVRWFMRDLDMRATLVARTVEDPITELARVGNAARIGQFFTKISPDERISCARLLSEPGREAVLDAVLIATEQRYVENTAVLVTTLTDSRWRGRDYGFHAALLPVRADVLPDDDRTTRARVSTSPHSRSAHI